MEVVNVIHVANTHDSFLHFMINMSYDKQNSLQL